MSGLLQPGPAAYQPREPEEVKPGAVRVSGRGRKHTSYQGGHKRGAKGGPCPPNFWNIEKKCLFILKSLFQ